jgi:hypothetical protein
MSIPFKKIIDDARNEAGDEIKKSDNERQERQLKIDSLDAIINPLLREFGDEFFGKFEGKQSPFYSITKKDLGYEVNWYLHDQGSIVLRLTYGGSSLKENNTDFSVGLFRSDFMLISEENHMKMHKNQ